MWDLDYKESWAPKNWCFWTVVLEKTLRVPLTARRSNQSILIILNIHWEDGCQRWNSNNFGHLMQRTDSFEKILMLGRIEGGRRRGWRGWDGWMASPTQWTWVWVNSRSWWWTGKPGVLHSMGHIESDTTERLNWIVSPHSLTQVPSGVFLYFSNWSHGVLFKDASRY